MATLPRIEVLKGDVSKVQLTSETRVEPAAKGRPARNVPVNKMRVHLRDSVSGRDADAVFTNSTVGVHQGHLIAFARAFVRGRRGPVMLTLINESTGQREEFPEGFAQAIRTEFFGPRWKAFGASSAIFLVGWLWNALFAQPTPGVWLGLWPLFLAFLAFPVLWAGVAALDSLTRVRSDGAAANAIRAEIARQTSGPRDVTHEIEGPRDDPGGMAILPPPR
ncbi:MAG: hypothetical protein SGJ23_17525 [Alphaproteobacteria bacterium]|nr:hypothetical protein [Alphaproteobacteria bacterium]